MGKFYGLLSQPPAVGSIGGQNRIKYSNTILRNFSRKEVCNMQNLMKDLTNLLKKDDRIFAEGKLLKNKLTELALKLDQDLIELLLSDKKAKEHFFIQKIIKNEKVVIFDKDKFISFINNKEFLPDSFTSFKNKIGLMTNGDYLKEKGDVVLAWAYKDCVLEGGQDKEDQKRDEIFYNEILAPDERDRLFEPKVFTNFKKY
jgi:adenine-specific DNA-methyltransferase